MTTEETRPRMRFAREAMVRAVMERHESPAEWPVAVRRIIEAAGLRAERVDMGGPLEMACFHAVEQARKGGNVGGLDALLDAIAAYAEGRNSRSTLFALEEAAIAYGKRPCSDELVRVSDACKAHARAVAR